MYDLTTFETEIQAMKPRIFDTYLLPIGLCYYAWASKGMPKSARRMLFISGIYMGYRSYASYKTILESAEAVLTNLKTSTPANVG